MPGTSSTGDLKRGIEVTADTPEQATPQDPRKTGTETEHFDVSSDKTKEAETVKTRMQEIREELREESHPSPQIGQVHARDTPAPGCVAQDDLAQEGAGSRSSAQPCTRSHTSDAWHSIQAWQGDEEKGIKEGSVQSTP